MGHLKMLVDQRTKNVALLLFTHGLNHLAELILHVLFVFVDNFCLFDVDSWLPSSGFISQSFVAILFEVPWFLAIEASPPFLFLFLDLSYIDVHVVLWVDMVALLLVEEFEEVSLHLSRISSSHSSLPQL
jgi:hypothetical protein